MDHPPIVIGFPQTVAGIYLAGWSKRRPDLAIYGAFRQACRHSQNMLDVFEWLVPDCDKFRAHAPGLLPDDMTPQLIALDERLVARNAR